VFTVEPGIYIREEGLGVRIENDIVITADGSVDLMKDIPVEAEEIEMLMVSDKLCQTVSVSISKKTANG